jgi:hypothetical protein
VRDIALRGRGLLRGIRLLEIRRVLGFLPSTLPVFDPLRRQKIRAFRPAALHSGTAIADVPAAENERVCRDPQYVALDFTVGKRQDAYALFSEENET